MNKFYKYWTILTLTLMIFGGIFYFIETKFSNTVSAQNNERKVEQCEKYKVIVLEDSQQKAIHVAYDFTTQTVSVVQIQKAFSPPAITVNSKSLTGK